MRPLSLVATTAAAALVGTTLLATMPGATSDAPTRSSAYGVSVNAGGQEVVPPSPTVESDDGSRQSTGGSAPPEAAPLVAGGLMELSAGDDRAAVSVTDLTLGNAAAELPPEVTDQLGQLQAACEGLGEAPGEQLPDVLSELPLGVEQPTEDDVVAFCDGLLDSDVANLATIDTLRVACDGDAGSVTVLGASALGSGVPVDLADVAPNTQLFPENPLISVTLNRQTRAPRGGFTVDGLVVSLAGGEAEAVVASTTCGQGITAEPVQDQPEPRRAPAPQPQQESVPVTG